MRLKLKIAMLEKGISGRQLAREVGINESIMSLVVNGKYNLSPDQQERIARVLEKPIDQLFR